MSTFEKIVQCLSHLSQVGLLILAIFGYFYTVKPLYTKSVLEEEIAKKQLETIEKDKTIHKINEEIAKKRAEVAAVSGDVSKLRSKIGETSSRYHQVKHELNSTTHKLNSTQGEYHITMQELATARSQSKVYYDQLKVKAMEVLKINTNCTGAIAFLGDKEIKFIDPTECLEKAVSSKEFKEVSDLLNPADKAWLLRSITEIGPLLKPEASKLVNTYKQTYTAYKTEQDKFEKDLAMDSAKAKDFDEKLADLEAKRQTIRRKTDSSIKQLDYQFEAVKGYNRLIKESLAKVASDFGVPATVITVGDDIIKADY